MYIFVIFSLLLFLIFFFFKPRKKSIISSPSQNINEYADVLLKNDEWFKKNSTILSSPPKMFVDIPPVDASISRMCLIAACHNCYSVFDTEGYRTTCPFCSSKNISIGAGNRFFMGRWNKELSIWIYAKDSAHPHSCVKII